jgi:hypothetical protein
LSKIRCLWIPRGVLGLVVITQTQTQTQTPTETQTKAVIEQFMGPDPSHD